ncbi:hypothetical protein GPJ56_006809 [Histomonas meleagridis]|nr:hypothetical protein GPJ56_006809 [Histomonas meleagridis]
MNSTNLTDVQYSYISDVGIDLSNFLVADDYFNIRCPTSTFITDYYSITSQCLVREYPLKLSGRYTVSYIGDSSISTTKNVIEFINSTFVPNNYIDIPEVYLGVTFSLTSSSVAGKVITIVGIVLCALMIAEYIFLCCLCSCL